MNSFAGGPGAVIEARGLTKRYGSKLAVDDLSFTVQQGRVTGFLGPNGAGKSSTMRLLLGLDRPDSGAATIAGGLGALLPGTVGRHVNAYLPANAGLMITHAHQEATKLLSPWQGFGVFCLWTAALLAVAGFLVARRDA